MNPNITAIIPYTAQGMAFIKKEAEKEKNRARPFDNVSTEIIVSIFSLFQQRDDLRSCARVCKHWNFLINNSKLSDVIWKTIVSPEITFGKKKWEKYFSDVGEEPSLPRNIDKILESSCPFFKGQKIKNTHMLTLIPKTINNEPLTLISFQSLLKKNWRYSLHKIVAEKHGDTVVDSSYWVLMTKKEIPEIKGREIAEDRSYVAGLAGKDGYELPHAIDATISVFMNFIFENIKTTKHWSMRCQEMVNVNNVNHPGKYPVSVTLLHGEQDSLSVRDGSFGNSFYSVAACRRLFQYPTVRRMGC